MLTLEFYAVVTAPRLIRDHQRMGGRDLAHHGADLQGGEMLRVISGKEPIPRLTLRVSISIGRGSYPGTIRRPTDDECKAACNMWPHVKFAEDDDSIDEHIRSFGEVS